jgi:hypothetical protein
MLVLLLSRILDTRDIGNRVLVRALRASKSKGLDKY